MAIVDADWSIDRATGDIRYIGGDHGASPTYATVLELHRWIQGLADDAEYVGDDEMDIINTNPTSRSTDNIITFLGTYNIDANAAEHLYDGSIIQGSGGTEEYFDGVVNFGNASVQIQIIQGGVVLADDWWNFGGAGLNADATQGISHRFMIKTRAAGADIDARKLLGTSRTFGNTYSEFPINGTSRGNNVLALADSSDLNNITLEATIAAYTDVYLDRTISTATVSGVNATGQAVLNTTDGTQFTAGGFIMINGDDAEYQILSISVNALTLNHNLDVATTGLEAIYDLNIGFSQIDVDNNASNEDYYAQWDLGAQTINNFYERLKWLSRDGSTEYIYGLPAELFRGITAEIVVDTPTGTFAAVEDISWTSGTGQMLAIDSPTAGTKLWLQLLTGTNPVDNDVITGGISSATVTMAVTITDRSALIKTPFVGASTGSALIGSYGLTLQTTDLAATDKVFDLTNAQITPPNNVTFDVGGVVIGEDYVLVAPWDGVTNDADGNPAVDFSQDTQSVLINGAAVTSIVVNTAIPSDTPSSGSIRVETNSGFYQKCDYTSWTGSTYTITAENFSGDPSDGTVTPKNVFITYIDKLATATTESFTGVYSADRTLVIKVRDGAGTPIKEYIAQGSLGSNGGSTTAIRTTDA